MWKEITIDQCPTGYSISSDGRVKNKHGRLLKPCFENGYYTYRLSYNGIVKGVRAHRLVAMAFIPNPENKPQVNHIDGNRINNQVENLEWVTAQENAQHAVSAGLHRSGRNRAVIQYNMSGQKMMCFQSIEEAVKQTGCLSSKISLCCCRKRRSTNGYQWRYADDRQDVVRIEPKWSAGTCVARCDENFNILQVYPSYSEAARSVNGSASAISRICTGTNQHHKGYRWKIVEEIVQNEI